MAIFFWISLVSCAVFGLVSFIDVFIYTYIYIYINPCSKYASLPFKKTMWNQSGQISSRPHMTDFPQMVVGRKGNPLFQGNRSVGEIFFHLARSMRCFGFSCWEPFSSKNPWWGPFSARHLVLRSRIWNSGDHRRLLAPIPLQREFLRFLQVLTVSTWFFQVRIIFCCRNGPNFQVYVL